MARSVVKAAQPLHEEMSSLPFVAGMVGFDVEVAALQAGAHDELSAVDGGAGPGPHLLLLWIVLHAGFVATNLGL